MVRITEIEDDDDSMERVNLDDYHFDHFVKYLSDDNYYNSGGNNQYQS